MAIVRAIALDGLESVTPAPSKDVAIVLRDASSPFAGGTRITLTPENADVAAFVLPHGRVAERTNAMTDDGERIYIVRRPAFAAGGTTDNAPQAMIATTAPLSAQQQYNLIQQHQAHHYSQCFITTGDW